MSNQNNTSSQQASDTLQQDLDRAASVTKQKIQNDNNLARELGVTLELQNEVVDIEKELLDQIIKRVDQKSMSTEDAQQLAREFLSLLPVKDQTDLLNKLKKLSITNSAAKGIYIEYAKPLEEEETKQKLELISQYLHQGKIEEALVVAKGKNNV